MPACDVRNGINQRVPLMDSGLLRSSLLRRLPFAYQQQYLYPSVDHPSCYGTAYIVLFSRLAYSGNLSQSLVGMRSYIRLYAVCRWVDYFPTPYHYSRMTSTCPYAVRYCCLSGDCLPYVLDGDECVKRSSQKPLDPELK